MKLYFLGVNGWKPLRNQTSCFLLETDNNLIILDAGTGLAYLQRYKDILDRYDEINLILSHYHLDHVIGLTYISSLFKDKVLNIYAPGKSVYGERAECILKRLLEVNFSARPLKKLAKEVHVIDYNSNFNIGKDKVEITAQDHTAPSFEIKVGDIIYATDTKLKKPLKSAKFLLHECWNADKNKYSEHTSLEEIIETIDLENYVNVYLIHQNPDWTNEEIEEIKNRIKNKNIFLPKDFDELILDT